MNTVSDTVVLLTHGVGVTASSFDWARRVLGAAGCETDVFDWDTEMRHRRGRSYGMRHLRRAYERRLDTYHHQGRQVIAINHSTGCYVGGYHHHHPAIAGSVHLALPPWGPYLKLGRTTGTGEVKIPFGRTMEIAGEILRGSMVTFSPTEQVAYGTDPQHTGDGQSITISGSVLRGFGLPGYYLPPNWSPKPCLVHVSDTDQVVAPAWRTVKTLRLWGYGRIGGWNQFSHCSYTTPGTEMVQFWRMLSDRIRSWSDDNIASTAPLGPIAMPAE